MPLPGERLVAFLSDGAFEEQRGPDWAPRWWRAEDSGMVAPIMINNGRRIDQRTTMNQMGGVHWLMRHLRLNGFDPFVIDGRDPAAFAWAIIETEFHLQEAAESISAGKSKYPVRLPYTIAVTVKGHGFYGEGTNAAHSTPIGTVMDVTAIQRFNAGARALFVPGNELSAAIRLFQRHRNRVKEKDNPFVHRDIKLKNNFKPDFKKKGEKASPMKAVDEVFVGVCKANPQLRPRIGNPDELSSNRMLQTLAFFKHRVTSPEPEINESVNGEIITALNEEAIASAALANKGGINIIVTYEAFGVKMHGILRQEVIFANHCNRHNRPQKWLSIPVVLTSHAYENGKNEQSHQDPMLCEAMMGEPAYVSRVVFPADYNSAAEVMREVYRTRGQIWTLVNPKAEIPVVFDRQEAKQLVRQGAVRVEGAGYKAGKAEIILTAVGAYQLREVLKASERLQERKICHYVVYMLEPRRWSRPKDEFEARVTVSQDMVEDLYPQRVRSRLFVTHTRAGRIEGLYQQTLNTGAQTRALGYINEGGTFTTAGMLFVNHQSWAHCLEACADLLGIAKKKLLTAEEISVLEHRKSPHGIIF
jgi:phosphoketolase